MPHPSRWNRFGIPSCLRFKRHVNHNFPSRPAEFQLRNGLRRLLEREPRVHHRLDFALLHPLPDAPEILRFLLRPDAHHVALDAAEETGPHDPLQRLRRVLQRGLPADDDEERRRPQELVAAQLELPVAANIVDGVVE